VPTTTICKQLEHVQNFALTTNNYQEFLLQIFDPRSSQILPIAAQVRFAQVAHIKTFPAFPH
jgi:hypothetical protein